MWTSFGWGQRWWDRRSTWSGAATAWFSRLLVGPNTWGELYYKRSTDGGDNWGPDVWLDRAGDPAAAHGPNGSRRKGQATGRCGNGHPATGDDRNPLGKPEHVVMVMVGRRRPKAEVRERLAEAAMQFENLGKKAMDVANELRRIAR